VFSIAAIAAVLLLPAVHAAAQGVAELEERLAEASGVERVEVLLDLARAHEYRAPEKVQRYAGHALEEARAAGRVDLAARALLSRGTGLFQAGELDHAEASYREGLETARPIGAQATVGGCLNGLAAVALKRGDQDAALGLFGEAMAALEEAGDLDRLAGVYNNRSLIYYAKGQLDRSLDDMTAALETYRELGNEQGEGIVLNSIGALYSRLEEPEKARERFQAALEIAERTGHTHLLLSALVNLGELHAAREEWDAALERFERALAAARTAASPEHIAVCLNNIGDVLRATGDLDGALDRYQESLRMFEEMHARPRLVASWLNLGHTYLALDRRTEAERYLAQAFEAAEETGELNLQRDAAAALGTIAEGRGDFRRALELQRTVADLEKTIFSRDNIARAASVEAELAAARQEQRIALLTKEAEIRDLEARRQRLVLIAGTLGLVALGIVVLVLWSRYRIKVRSEAELSVANERILELARHDSLTGLLNRRSGQERLDVEAARSRRTGRPFCLLMLDLDDFKRVNDDHGHDCGDALLVHVAELLTTRLRSQDMVARWGGEEILVLLPETERDGAAAVAEELRRALERVPLECSGNVLRSTVTVGVAEHAPGGDADATLKRADEALYEGKRAGKNRVV
jgi:diguanylate cyclase (GGDEF)-like protein